MEVDGNEQPTTTKSLEKTITRNLSPREKRDCAVIGILVVIWHQITLNIIERLIKGYFNIVRKSIQVYSFFITHNMPDNISRTWFQKQL